MTKAKQKQPGQRQLRVGELIRHAISDILLRGEIFDPRLEKTSVTVSEARVSPDLKNATVFVMPLAGTNQETVMEGLQDQAPQIRKLVSNQIRQKFMPKLHFKLDKSFDEASKIESILQSPEVQRDLRSDDDQENDA